MPTMPDPTPLQVEVVRLMDENDVMRTEIERLRAALRKVENHAGRYSVLGRIARRALDREGNDG
jgi:regulator of replication initiation timing